METEKYKAMNMYFSYYSYLYIKDQTNRVKRRFINHPHRLYNIGGERSGVSYMWEIDFCRLRRY